LLADHIPALIRYRTPNKNLSMAGPLKRVADRTLFGVRIPGHRDAIKQSDLPRRKSMTDQNIKTSETPADGNESQTNSPDWIVKAARGHYKNSYLERVGAAWNRDDGGIGVRLHGKQLVDGDIYLYPNEPVSS